jgi:hypothetical protein
MRRIILTLIFLIVGAGFTSGQNIQTVAGGGPNNVPATSAKVGLPGGIIIDLAGNIYSVGYGYRVFKVYRRGQLKMVAGNGTEDYCGDGGPATSASLYNPWDVAVDGAGNLYIADSHNLRIRKIDTSGTINTVAGNGTEGHSGDGGPATSASL